MRFVAVLALSVSCLCAQKRPLDVQAMLQFSRIAEPQVSPDGKQVAFTVQTIDLDKNAKPRQIWTVPLDGGAPRQITRDGNNDRPRWTPDSKTILFTSTRGGGSQVWRMDPDGSNAKQLTTLSTEASGPTISPDGKWIIFLSEVYPDCPDDACNKKRLDTEAASKVKARIYTSLLYRHWTEFQGAKRKHLFSMSLEPGGAPKDLTPGMHDVPPFSLGGSDDYAISPDSKEVAYVMNGDTDQALSTNSDLWVVPIEGGESKKVTINPGADNSPAYSADGKSIAFRSQQRGGYESDRWRLQVLDRASGRTVTLTDNLDRNVASFTWSVDSKRIFFLTEDRGRTVLQMIPAAGGSSRVLISGGGHIDDVQFPADGKTMVYSEMGATRPTEIYKVSSSGGAAVALTKLNEPLMQSLAIAAVEDFWVKAPDDTQVNSFLMKPPDFRPSQKYPVLFLIHGGPQGAWGDSWSYRWNPQVFANAGFVVVMPNPRGSTGYGQKFTDDINQDWGGKVYDDVMAVVDHVAGLPYVDAERMAAAGGSYGGYMVNWMLGHTTRFKAFVSHAGVYDLRSMAGETEELWFPMWEFKGMPWDNKEVYEKFSPSYYVTEFKTPTLVIHGEIDYRVPVGQGLQLFTSLQMKKVPSKLLLFPDEGHWILKPQNTVLWYNSFLDWVTEWTRKR